MKKEHTHDAQTLHIHKRNLKALFLNGASAVSLSESLVAWVDKTLIQLFKDTQLDKTHAFCLLALGSYGRRELMLHSDIDIILLHHEDIQAPLLKQAERFIQACWDIGLTLGHQITTVKACAELASNDLTVMSSLIDMHLVAGNTALMESLQYETHPIHMWPSDALYLAKKEEQDKRLLKYGDTAYNLEPNVKNGPGGLRDIQIIFTIAKRHFGYASLSKAISKGFINEKEYATLIECQHFLWRVRFALHCFADKPEERLIFDRQKQLADFWGLKESKTSLAVEQFMQNYFKVIRQIRELNEICLQWFSETILHHQKLMLIPLDNTFQLANGYLEARNPLTFSKKPLNLLLIFEWLLSNPEIKGIRSNTIRLIHQYSYLFNTKFLAAKTTKQAFLKLFTNPLPRHATPQLQLQNSTPRGLSAGSNNGGHTMDPADKPRDVAFCTQDVAFCTRDVVRAEPYIALQWMNRLGLLGRYLDAFSAVTDRMQYDLFHVFTVDQHTLFVIRNLGRFTDDAYHETFPLCVDVMKKITKRHCLYLAGLFHDIAKGRGGDHAELGALEVLKFAKRHRLPDDERDLISWLVEHHLLMSHTAQRKDIYAPKTIQAFLSMLPHPHYLDYLYLLTVADISATNPALWTPWKDALLKELYLGCIKAIDKAHEAVNEAALIKTRLSEAEAFLPTPLIEKANALWLTFKPSYFLHETPEIIAKHTEHILTTDDEITILCHPHKTGAGTEVVIYMPHRPDRFTVTTTLMANHHLSIHEAFISSGTNNYDLDSYIILTDAHEPLTDKKAIQLLTQQLKDALSDSTSLPTLKPKRQTLAQAHFNITPSLQFYDEDPLVTALFLLTSDRPGLLANISRVLSVNHIYLHSAKIATAGERAEDMFYITNEHNEPLNVDEKARLSEALVTALSE